MQNIYVIYNKETNRKYVGRARNVDYRFKKHMEALKGHIFLSMDLSSTRFDTLCRLLNLCIAQHSYLEIYHAQSCTQSLKSLRGHLLIFITSFIGEYTTKEGELK